MCCLGRPSCIYYNKARMAGFYVPGADEAVSGISVSFLLPGTEWNTSGGTLMRIVLGLLLN